MNRHQVWVLLQWATLIGVALTLGAVMAVVLS